MQTISGRSSTAKSHMPGMRLPGMTRQGFASLRGWSLRKVRRGRYPEGVPQSSVTAETNPSNQLLKVAEMLALRELLEARRDEFQVLLDR